MSGRQLAIVLCALGLLLAGWRWHAVGRRVEANSVATYAERTLAQALRQFGGALPRRFLEDNLARLERARVTDPSSVEAAVSQAGYLFLLRRHEPAEKVYFEALRLEERAEIYGNLARLYMQENRPEEAIEPIRKAMQIDPQMSNLLQPMLDNAERAAAAKEAAEKARRENPGAPVEEPGANENAGLIFSEDFESGQLLGWSQVDSGIGGDPFAG